MNGGHSPTKTNYLLSYEDEVKQIKNEHIDWQSTDIRKEAASRFRPRFRQDKVAFEKESSNFQEYDGPEFTLKNGEVYYSSYGRTLEELNTRTLEITPEQYSLAQHQTSAMINKAFKSGATEVVTSYYREGEDHRDLIVMKIDPVTGVGKTRIINCAQDGNYRNFTNMQSLAKSRFTTHYEIRPTNNVFLLSNKPVRHEIARATVKEVAHQFEDRVRYRKNTSQSVASTVSEASKHTFHEVKSTMMTVDTYMERTYGKRLQDIPLMTGESLIHRVRRLFEHKKDIVGEKLLFENQRDQHQDIEKVRVRKWEINLLGYLPEKIRQTRRQVREKFAPTIATLLFVRATGVGVGGIFVSLESIAHIPQKSLEMSNRRRKEKQKRKDGKLVLLKRRRVLGEMRVFRMSENFKKLTKKEQRKLRRREKILRAKEKRALQHKERSIKRQKETVLHMSEKKLLRRSERMKEKQLWNILRRFMKKESFKPSRSIEKKSLARRTQRKETTHTRSIKEKNIQIANVGSEHLTRQQEKRYVIDFSVVLVIWLLLHMQAPSQQKEKQSALSAVRREKPKKLIPKKLTQWLLLAIIWHLVMLREQGMRRGTNDPRYTKKPVQKLKILWRSQLPAAGVIFAFAS